MFRISTCLSSIEHVLVNILVMLKKINIMSAIFRPLTFLLANFSSSQMFAIKERGCFLLCSFYTSGEFKVSI